MYNVTQGKYGNFEYVYIYIGFINRIYFTLSGIRILMYETMIDLYST